MGIKKARPHKGTSVITRVATLIDALHIHSSLITAGTGKWLVFTQGWNSFSVLPVRTIHRLS